MPEYRVLDLFCGLGGFSQAFADSKRWAVTTVDIEERFAPDIVADVFDLRPSDFSEQYDVVVAGHPCTLMSTSGNHEEWDMDEKVPTGERAQDHTAMVYHTLGLIRGLNPEYWYLENPRHGRMTWLLGEPTGTVTYCQYGAEYMKPTGLWGTHPPMEYRRCTPGDGCHVSNTMDDGTSAIASMGHLSHAERSAVPYNLSDAIRAACERALDGEAPEQATVADF
jgi:hypothetical protein